MIHTIIMDTHLDSLYNPSPYVAESSGVASDSEKLSGLPSHSSDSLSSSGSTRLFGATIQEGILHHPSSTQAASPGEPGKALDNSFKQYTTKELFACAKQLPTKCLEDAGTLLHCKSTSLSTSAMSELLGLSNKIPSEFKAELSTSVSAANSALKKFDAGKFTARNATNNKIQYIFYPSTCNDGIDKLKAMSNFIKHTKKKLGTVENEKKLGTVENETKITLGMLQILHSLCNGSCYTKEGIIKACDMDYRTFDKNLPLLQNILATNKKATLELLLEDSYYRLVEKQSTKS